MNTVYFLIVMFSLSSNVEVNQFGPFANRAQCEEAAMALKKAGKGWRAPDNVIDFATCVKGGRA